MSVYKSFANKKDAASPFLTLKDGESATVSQVREIKIVTKQGYGNQGDVEVLRFVCDVRTSEGLRIKNFDVGSKKGSDEMEAKGIVEGSSFTVTRRGEKMDTRYELTNVVNPEGSSTDETPIIEETEEADETSSEVPF